MRILIFHGYLLEGTGSNIYNARLAAALRALGHEVHLLTQERHPERSAFIDQAGDWEGGRLCVRSLDREPGPGAVGSCTVYRPDVGELLPVYVYDEYEGLRARTFRECTDAQLHAYVDANVAAVAEVAERVRPDLGLANHLVMGPAILARALGGRVPYAVKVHGSALEYTVRPQPERFVALAREGLEHAAGVLVGSSHTAESLWEVLDAGPELRERTRLGPPGVDVERFAPRSASARQAGLKGLVARLQDEQPDRAPGDGAFARDAVAAAAAVASLEDQDGPLVAYVGKLIVSKGVDLLIACWPLVLAEVPDAKLVIVGFGAFREALEGLVDTLGRGELEAAIELARKGRRLEAGDSGEGGEIGELSHLRVFVEGLTAADAGDARSAYVRAAALMPERVLFTGRLDHGELTDLLPACDALSVPSTFPEAFGMVAVEAAACGVFPVSAAHSGLREVSDVLAEALGAGAAPWLSFQLGDGAVRALAGCLVAWLRADPDLRMHARAALVAAVRARWSWESVAAGVIAAARGDLQELARPAAAAGLGARRLG